MKKERSSSVKAFKSLLEDPSETYKGQTGHNFLKRKSKAQTPVKLK